jgi:ComF family protein
MACRHLIPVNDPDPLRLRLCGHCRDLFESLPPPVCSRCGAPVRNSCADCYGRVFYFSSNTSAFIYDDILRDLLHGIKFRGNKTAARGLGELWADIYGVNDFNGADYLVPVPLHFEKQRERGFNQAEILAVPLSERFGIPLAVDMLIRTLYTTPQSGLSPRGRVENVSGAFQFNQSCNINNKKILLIDDIYTTGASLNECAKILHENGASEIFCMTLSMRLKKNKNDDDM